MASCSTSSPVSSASINSRIRCSDVAWGSLPVSVQSDQGALRFLRTALLAKGGALTRVQVFEVGRCGHGGCRHHARRHCIPWDGAGYARRSLVRRRYHLQRSVPSHHCAGQLNLCHDLIRKEATVFEESLMFHASRAVIELQKLPIPEARRAISAMPADEVENAICMLQTRFTDQTYDRVFWALSDRLFQR